MSTVESVSSAQLLKNTDPEEFDLVILGGGTGSTIAAWTFAGEGKRVALIDRNIYRRIVPEHRLFAHQEHYSQRQGRIVRSQKRRVRHPQEIFLRWI